MNLFKISEIKSILIIAMMGRLGPAALGAGALGTSVFIVCIVFCMGIMTAAGVFISRARGALQYEDISQDLRKTLKILP